MTRFVITTLSEITIILIYFGEAAALLFLLQIAKMIKDTETGIEKSFKKHRQKLNSPLSSSTKFWKN